jgi:hypothetical protein
MSNQDEHIEQPAGQDRIQRVWFTKGLHEGKDQMKSLISGELEGWKVLAKAAEDKVSQLQARVRELEQALEIACGSGKFANPKAAAAKILAHVTDKAVKP